MQTIKHHRDSAAFNEFVKQVQGFLTARFGVAANHYGIALVADYFARGRTPAYCAWALARHDRLRGPS